ncbi:MAG: META domain-containing protein [Rickettsiales bacterium]|nr:META domain-containing protein [Rickettsiales bacterium]
MKKIILYILLLIVLATSSVFAFKKYSNRCVEVEFSSILNKEYAYVGENNIPTNLTVIFSEDGRVSGFSGVNKYFAGYKLEDNNQIKLSTIGTTMNVASEKELNSERQYIKVLNNVNKVKVCKNKLLLKNDDKILNFIPTGKEITEVIIDITTDEVASPSENDVEVNTNNIENQINNDESQAINPTEESDNTEENTDNNALEITNSNI